ncbi:MAG: hypothetical protein EA403_16190 [Spirochaetaceae bacterium]|nr:MAG: hypothetical protein EA403_16190 [Spirochaetaceae bacterium]
MRDHAGTGVKTPVARPRVRAAAVWLAAAVVLLAGCRTAPAPIERDLVAYLPADQGAWFFVNDALTGEAVLGALLPESISADQLSQVVDRTDLVVASMGRLGDGGVNLVASGRYPRRIVERNLRRDGRWTEHVLERGAPAARYFEDPSTGYQIAVLRSGPVLISQGAIRERLEQAGAVEAGRPTAADAAVAARLAAFEQAADRRELTIFVPSPGRDSLARLGGAAIRVPIQAMTVFVDRTNGSLELSGVIALETDQDARAFHVLFRLLFLATVRDAGLNMQRLAAELETARVESEIQFAGVVLDPDELRQLVQRVTENMGSR